MKNTQADTGTGVSLGRQFTDGWFWIAIVCGGNAAKAFPRNSHAERKAAPAKFAESGLPLLTGGFPRRTCQ